MKIVFAASEMAPYSKTGGLADVIGSLPQEVRLLGNEVLAFVPRYKSTDPEAWKLETVLDRLDVPLGTEKEAVRVFHRMGDDGVSVYFIDHPEFFCRDGFYGTALGDYPDNDRRFALFQRAVLETLKALHIKPDVIHCHDWQTGLIPVYLKTLYTGSVFQKTKSIFTIHNLAYQGNFPPDSLPMTGLSWDHFKMERLEFYGKFSFLKGGILDADSVTTVSEKYAEEILTREFGCGMEGVLAKRKPRLSGILNGIDVEEWNPEKDRELVSPFSLKKIDKKFANKTALQKENGFAADSKTPLIGMVSRLIDQKGIDILIGALPAIFELGFQVVALGTGEEKYHQVLRDLAKKNKSRLGIHILFDATMAKRIYAGCDMMFFPSYYEPCGLGQMIALRFGTIPVVRATGGLADTIEEFNPANRSGNGFSFKDYSAEALTGALHRAFEIYRAGELWPELVRNAMACDFSWTASARKYVRLYETTKRHAAEGMEK